MEVMVYLNKLGSNKHSPSEIVWNLLANGQTLFTIYKHNTGIWFMLYEDLEQPISEAYALSLIKGWRQAKFTFFSVPIGFYNRLKGLKNNV